MKKKILKGVGIVVLLIVIILVAAPFFLQDKISDIIKNKMNNSLHATVDFAEADLSFFSNFPNAQITLKDISLINKAPFKGDTLFASQELKLKMSIKELFKDEEDPISITSLSLDKAVINVKVDTDGNANYDITKASEDETVTSSEEEDNGFNLVLESYEILDTRILYSDATSGMVLELLEMNHTGTGDLSLDTSELDTHTETLVSFSIDSTNYLRKNKIRLDARIGVNLKENKYTFLKNEALINKLALVFDGFIKVNENNQEVAIDFKTPSTDFKNFLALIPETYSKNIEDVKTSGNFALAGKFFGVIDDDHIPKFNININSEDASFKYPELPKTVRNMNIDIGINNATGITENTHVDIRKLSFNIDEDRFNMSSKISELMGNTKVNAHIDAHMNLANISKAYPVPEDLDLKGVLKADITTAFDMASIEKEQYDRTKTSGQMSLKNFEYKTAEIPNAIKVTSTALTFNPSTVRLNEFSGETGQTDFKATGTLNNFLGFMFNDEKVKGNFNLHSNTFALNDFMVEEVLDADTSEKSKESNTESILEEQIKIPSFLDCTINATASNVLYDNLNLKNVKGKLQIKDEKAVLSDMTSDIFGGVLAFAGTVSTKAESTSFDMNLGMKNFKIGETFKSMELFKVLAPIANILKGKLDSDIAISGNLNNDFTPDLTTISGKVLTELLATDIDPKKTKILSGLSDKLQFLKSDKINVKGLKTALSFEDGKVTVKPFAINYEDFVVNIAGGHTFDNQLDYTATLDVPAKYLGKEVTDLIAKIDETSLKDLNIPIVANIGGNYKDPNISTDLSSGIKGLTSKLIDIQKQKLIGKGKDKAKSLIGDVLSKNSKKGDSTKENSAAETGKKLLGGLLGNDKKKDSAKADSSTVKKNNLKETSTKVLGTLFGKKKKKKKDTIQ